ncbi:MAG: NAD(P)/FAD-dependent oxidoreductase [Desulfobacterales bacterium]|nr:NAD(P)/FAD-dependent oxidoreductase [Desulfobacteraceae bacterium]MBT4365372.1 NAD(P)/FAD-dependent oxidoreductase [Desulfobacteraceae bacterium]MBT7084859.1 NAD(P)/FAD-dependent oxidoreductase [Desulfobacterales bacterium]MBT7698258.1 NAD(P)/FAD-dependent oxidoreductase [Desulfobacterales bacterium]
MGQTYDAIIIGAGMGGLMCGNFLARKGWNVIILEHNHQPGGLMTGIKRKGFYFDTGDQSMEDSGIIFPLLKLLDLYDENEWDNCTVRYIIKDRLDYVLDNYENMAEKFCEAFPKDKKGITNHFKKISDFSDLLNEIRLKALMPNTSEGIKRIVNFIRFMALNIKNFKKAKELFAGKFDDMIKKDISDPEAVEFLVSMGYPEQSMFMGVGALNCHVNDYWYPKNGIQGIINKLADNFKALGGEIKYKTLVDEILLDGKRVKGVKTNNGDEFTSKKVVSCGDMVRLFTEMLPQNIAKPEYIKKITEAPVTEPFASVYIGLDIPQEDLTKILKAHHTFYFTQLHRNDISKVDDPDLHSRGWIEINAPGVSCPELMPEGKSAITVQILTNYKWMDNWGTGGDDTARPEKYRELKNKVADDVLDMVENVIPDIREKIEFLDVSTPLSTIRFTLNKDGASCAFTVDPDKSPFAEGPYPFRTPVRGLYQAGHWTYWPGGVIGAAMSGKMVASKMISGRFSDLTDRIYQIFH